MLTPKWLGGAEALTEGERAIVRRVATLQTEAERLELTFATNGGATAQELDLYSRVSGNLRRLLESLGLARTVKARGMRAGR